MKKISWFALVLLFPICLYACKKTKSTVQQPAANSVRVLGYVFSPGTWNEDMATLDLTKLTDINLAFVNPDAAGQFPANESLRQAVQTGHAKNIRVYFSIGGGDPPAHLANLMEDGQRSNFISNIVALAEQYQFDGVDVDLENSLINQYYAAFVSELSVALKAKQKKMTSALASWNSNLIATATLNLYDYINIMSYDKTGPWNLGNPGQHSPYSMVEADFNYYHVTRGIPAEKLLIGLPFYGYGFGANAPSSLPYKEIITQYPGAENQDEVTVNGGGKIYYNGIPTIQQKVEFVKNQQAAGVMIWELQQDSRDAKSLLKAVHDKISQ